MPTRFHILICDSHRAKVAGGGCCSDKGGGKIKQAFEDAIQDLGLENDVQVLHTGCLANCREGISVRILPERSLYGKVHPEDVVELVRSHIIERKPLKRLLVQPKVFS
ncbi:MAG: (2Fe-2S) ferredoxin domain-containing protein [Bacteroidota bacterium]